MLHRSRPGPGSAKVRRGSDHRGRGVLGDVNAATGDAIARARSAGSMTRRSTDVILRTLDMLVSAVALIVLLPLFVLMLGVVLVTSGRPLFYAGERVGREGRLFTMRKVRTLVTDAEARIGGYYGAALDERLGHEVTRVGRALRATHLDEVPQLWNVLKGDMSVVGPRPLRPRFFEDLCAEIPQYWQRLTVRPGLTGLAQIRMTRYDRWNEKLAHDLEWIADRSVGSTCSRRSRPSGGSLASRSAGGAVRPKAGARPRRVGFPACAGSAASCRSTARVDRGAARAPCASTLVAPGPRLERRRRRRHRSRSGARLAIIDLESRRPADRERGRHRARRPERRDLQLRELRERAGAATVTSSARTATRR